MAWLVILLLIAVNALYVAAEFAAVSLRVTQLQPLAQRGDRRAKGRLAALVEHRQPLLRDRHERPRGR